MTSVADISPNQAGKGWASGPDRAEADRVSLKDKIRSALNETRMLVLGSQVLLGFQYQAVFRPGFDRLPEHGKLLDCLSLVLMLTTLALLIAPAAFHRIADEGCDTVRTHRCAGRMAARALIPFALAIGMDCTIVAEKLMSTPVAVLFGIVVAATAFGFWFGYELMVHPAQQGGGDGPAVAVTSLKDKIEQILTEARIILPGGQALLGFQFAAILSEGYDDLPLSSRQIHFSSLALMTLSMVMLMAPAAYHRLVSAGEATEDMDRFGVRMVLGALIPLGFALAGDLYVVVTKVSRSSGTGIGTSLLALAIFAALWLVYPLAARRQRRQAEARQRATEPPHE
jgi:hypothetical protein